MYISDGSGDIIEQFDTSETEIRPRIDNTWKRFCVSMEVKLSFFYLILLIINMLFKLKSIMVIVIIDLLIWVLLG